MKKTKNIRQFVYFCILLILVLVMLFSGLRILESTILFKQQEEQKPSTTKTITRNGIDYYPRQDIKVLMVLGIDQFGPVADSGSYNNGGAADMVTLLIFDEKEKTVDVLCLNRDTMLEMPVLGIGGKQAGTFYGQLALAHTYGSGLEDSCENTKKAVSDFLHGITVDYYVSMNMDAITILNDAVGGVTVHVTEDFSKIDPSITQGTLTLHGDQAINFVRTRKDVGDQMNVSRIERQKEYMNGFLASFRTMQSQSSEFVASTYASASDYIVTDCSVNTISGMLNRYADYTLGQIFTPEGQNVMGEKYYEFYADEEKLDALILDLFYAAK